MQSFGIYDIGGCFWGPSYFKGSDGIGRIVSSGGSALKIWKVTTSASGPPTLVEESSTPLKADTQSGFFTSVSSNPKDLSTTIVWAVASTRPTLTLFAFDTAGKQIYEGEIGTWTLDYGLSAPVVANGRVYVGGNRELVIFEASIQPSPPPLHVLRQPPREPTMLNVGVVTAMDGDSYSPRQRGEYAVRKCGARH